MKSLLIGINAKYIHPSLALYQLKKNTSYSSTLLEFTIKETNAKICDDIFKQIDKETILIAFSCYLWNIEKILEISNIVKQNFPNIKVVLGGPEVGFEPNHFLIKYPHIDYIIHGEGEVSFDKLCQFLDGKISISEVDNLCYFDNNTYIQNNFTTPDLSKIELATLDINDLENRIVYLESGRGCPYSCSYCTASLDNRVRFFPLDKIKNIIEILINKKVKTIKFLDRTFNANMKYMSDILDFIDNHNICTTFQFEIVVEKFTKEIIDKIALLKNKFLRFEIGIQSIHSDVNKAVNRIQDMDKLEEKLLLLNKTNKVDLHVDLIAGLPFETKPRFIESFNRVFNYQVKELQLGFLKFLRGTKLLNTIDEHEYIYDQRPPYEIISNKYLSAEDLKEIHLVEDMLDHYYNSGYFYKTFDYLINNNLLTDAYSFFLNISNFNTKSQLIELFIHLDNYFKTNMSSNYNTLHFLLIQDYLEHHKTKPKIWWEYKVENRQPLYNYISKKINVSIETLYRYSLIYQDKCSNTIYIIIYQNFKPISYLIDNNLL